MFGFEKTEVVQTRSFFGGPDIFTKQPLNFKMADAAMKLAELETLNNFWAEMHLQENITTLRDMFQMTKNIGHEQMHRQFHVEFPKSPGFGLKEGAAALKLCIPKLGKYAEGMCVVMVRGGHEGAGVDILHHRTETHHCTNV